MAADRVDALFARFPRGNRLPEQYRARLRLEVERHCDRGDDDEAVRAIRRWEIRQATKYSCAEVDL